MSYDPVPLIDPRFLRSDDPREVVSDNERAVLRLARAVPPLSRSDIAGRMPLTQQSVHRILDSLADRGLVQFGPPRPGMGRGQPSPTVTLNPGYAWTVGLSVNTDAAGLCLMPLTGPSESVSVDIGGLGLAAALDRIADRLDRLLAARAVPRDRILGLGLGIAGYRVEGTTYNAPLPLHDWSLIELGPLLHRRFALPVWVENGASTAALAEAMLGVGRHIRSFAYLSFNYGFGGGLILDGELYAGSNGNAGEFSGIVDVEGGKRRPALALLIARLEAKGMQVPSVSWLKRNFRPDWPGVTDWVEEVTPFTNLLMNAIWSVIDPQAIVFGGEVPRALADMLIERVTFNNSPRYGNRRRAPKLIVSELDGEPSAAGAAAMPFKACLF
jgi:predicted NBD/HSP70 family sugar kinase